MDTEKIVSAAEANRKFSYVLSKVRQGCSYLVTSHGKSVAKIVPFRGYDAAASSSKATLLARLKSQELEQKLMLTEWSLFIKSKQGIKSKETPEGRVFHQEPG